MATNTDWSKFQRRQLCTLLMVQHEIGAGTSNHLDTAVTALRSEMEEEDIKRVMDEIARNDKK